MTEKRFTYEEINFCNDNFTGNQYDLTNPNEMLELLNELDSENKELKDKYERKDRQLQRAKKDTRKYTEYFMNELNWDCDRIIKEVFK